MTGAAATPRRDHPRMVRQCPECGGELVDLEPAAEMGSGPKRYDCPACQLRFESDASGLLTEVE